MTHERSSRARSGWTIRVTFQQFQKNERGANRIAVSTLFKVPKALEVSPTKVFADLKLSDGASPALVESVEFTALRVLYPSCDSTRNTA